VIDDNATELLSDDRPLAAPRTRVVISTTAEGAARLRQAVADGTLRHLGIVGIEPAPAETADTEPPPPMPTTEPAPADHGQTLREARAALADVANVIGRSSRRRGAPYLTADSPLDTLIRWHQWNDPNGCYSAAQCELEGFDPPTVERMWELLAEIEP